jgi:hypothetical protein
MNASSECSPLRASLSILGFNQATSAVS